MISNMPRDTEKIHEKIVRMGGATTKILTSRFLSASQKRRHFEKLRLLRVTKRAQFCHGQLLWQQQAVQFHVIIKYSTRAQRVTFLEFHTRVSGISLESRANGCHFCSIHPQSPGKTAELPQHKNSENPLSRDEMSPTAGKETKKEREKESIQFLLINKIKYISG